MADRCFRRSQAYAAKGKTQSTTQSTTPKIRRFSKMEYGRFVHCVHKLRSGCAVFGVQLCTLSVIATYQNAQRKPNNNTQWFLERVKWLRANHAPQNTVCNTNRCMM